MNVEDAIEEIKSDLIAKRLNGDDYSPMFREALAVLIRTARANEKEEGA